METKMKKEKSNRIEEWIVNNIDSYDHNAEIICLLSRKNDYPNNRLITMETRLRKKYRDSKSDHKELFFRYVREHERKIYVGKKRDAYMWATRFGVDVNKDRIHICDIVMNVIYDTYLNMLRERNLDQILN